MCEYRCLEFRRCWSPGAKAPHSHQTNCGPLQENVFLTAKASLQPPTQIPVRPPERHQHRQVSKLVLQLIKSPLTLNKKFP